MSVIHKNIYCIIEGRFQNNILFISEIDPLISPSNWQTRYIWTPKKTDALEILYYKAFLVVCNLEKYIDDKSIKFFVREINSVKMDYSKSYDRAMSVI